MVRLLVSVRDVAEALAAAGAGADFIDLKEPHDGALGAVPVDHVARIVPVLRARHPGVRISATVGDLPASEAGEILRRVRQVADCGVDDVKVGIWPSAASGPLLDALGDCRAHVVPVLVADAGIDPALVERALRRDAFSALMVDTCDKRAGGLLQRVPMTALAAFVWTVHSRGAIAGLAGSLRADDAPALLALGSDFAGFRSAVSRGDRTGALDARLVRALRGRLAAPAGARPRLPAAA